MYHLPLLPGYGPGSNIRSSLPAKSTTGKSILSRLSEAEEDGYQGTYFPAAHSPQDRHDGYISSESPVFQRKPLPPFSSGSIPETPASEGVPETPASELEPLIALGDETPASEGAPAPAPTVEDQDVAEVIFFEYGVSWAINFSKSRLRQAYLGLCLLWARRAARAKHP
jgi:hypothetical protein